MIHVALKDFERNGAILQMFSVSKESLNGDKTAALSASLSPAGRKPLVAALIHASLEESG